MIPQSIKIPVPNEYAFPHGAVFLSVDKAVDWDRLGAEDNQARNEHGVREWEVKVSDLDPNASRFGRSTERKVKIAAEYQPVPPDGVELPGGVVVRSVEFVGLTATPYVDTSGCRGSNKPHKCRARQAWSLRADAMVTPGSQDARSNAA